MVIEASISISILHIFTGWNPTIPWKIIVISFTGSIGENSDPLITEKYLKQSSISELNKKTFKLGTSIDKIKEEIVKLKTSRSRNNADISESFSTKIADREKELRSLQNAEKLVEKEKTGRRDKEKYCSF